MRGTAPHNGCQFIHGASYGTNVRGDLRAPNAPRESGPSDWKVKIPDFRVKQAWAPGMTCSKNRRQMSALALNVGTGAMST
jgi:hypothetical protein